MNGDAVASFMLGSREGELKRNGRHSMFSNFGLELYSKTIFLIVRKLVKTAGASTVDHFVTFSV
jgi:hypothetical protein